MKHSKQKLFALGAILALGLTNTAQAILIDRGDGLLYDDLLDITWLQDANYAQTSGHDTDGRMTWDNAVAWADNLIYGGYDDWRLPEFTGATTCAGINCDDSELAIMHYDTMGAGAFSSILSGTNSANLAMVNNLQSYVYWSGVPYAPTSTNAWAFSTIFGHQDSNHKGLELYAWAVRSGDVTASAPVPVPFWLFGGGLVAILGWRRKR